MKFIFKIFELYFVLIVLFFLCTNVFFLFQTHELSFVYGIVSFSAFLAIYLILKAGWVLFKELIKVSEFEKGENILINEDPGCDRNRIEFIRIEKDEKNS